MCLMKAVLCHIFIPLGFHTCTRMFHWFMITALVQPLYKKLRLMLSEPPSTNGEGVPTSENVLCLRDRFHIDQSSSSNPLSIVITCTARKYQNTLS